MNLNYIILQAKVATPINDLSVDAKMNRAGYEGLSFGSELLIIALLLIVLFWLYHTFFVKPRIGGKLPEKKKTSETVHASKQIQKETGDISDEVTAVIGLALHLYKQQLNDYEKARLTIARVSRTYSPWSSKIYGLRQNPRG